MKTSPLKWLAAAPGGLSCSPVLLAGLRRCSLRPPPVSDRLGAIRNLEARLNGHPENAGCRIGPAQHLGDYGPPSS